jgi:hypothetical protein
VYVFIENPFEKMTFDYIDSVSKPIIALVGLVGIKMMAFFSTEMIFVPIVILVLLFVSVAISIGRVIKLKLSRVNAAKKVLDEAEI